MRKTVLLLIVSFCLAVPALNAQRLINPVVESKTHPSLTIDSIALSNASSICYLTVTNMNTEGNAWFCADNNIDLIEITSGTKHRLQNSKGIPVCPEAHLFKESGEKLSFELHFGPLRDKNAEIDIIENCSDNCFSLKGIVLDALLNKEIRLFETGVLLYKKEKGEEALIVFEEIKNKTQYPKEKHVAYSYYILPMIYNSLENYDLARSSYQDLLKSEIKDKKYFIQKLQAEDFNWLK